MQIVQIIAVLGSLVLFVFVIDFIRRNLLKEKYAVLWISLSIVVTTLSFWKSLLDKLARSLSASRTRRRFSSLSPLSSSS